ncbi:hypothetical protein HY095_04680 [Candidatus Micrarchaeota archaeon]|nr:hypothetical protein [Candidatus Micrarchaeota archaeon]
MNNASLYANATCSISVIDYNNTIFVSFASMSNLGNGYYNYTLNQSAGSYTASINCSDSSGASVFIGSKNFNVVSACSIVSALAIGTQGGGNMILDFTLIAFLTLVSLIMIAVGYLAQSKMLMAIGGVFLMVTGGLFFDTRAGLGIQTLANTTSTVTLSSTGAVNGASTVNNYQPLQNEYVGGLGLAYLLVGLGVLLAITLQYLDERKKKPEEFESRLEA